MESILTSVKKLLGVQSDYEHFDTDIIMHINSALVTLHQLGIGPKNGFEITSDFETWNDYCSDLKQVGLVKQYLYLKVRLVFDPPSNSFVVDAINKQISELEWRLNTAAETISI